MEGEPAACSVFIECEKPIDLDALNKEREQAEQQRKEMEEMKKRHAILEYNEQNLYKVVDKLWRVLDSLQTGMIKDPRKVPPVELALKTRDEKDDIEIDISTTHGFFDEEGNPL